MSIDKIRVWDGERYRKTIGKVMTPDGLKDFYRPTDFQTDFITTTGMIRQPVEENGAIIKDGKLFFDTESSYSVYQPRIVLEDGFDVGHWMFEKWGASPENISNQPHDTGWKIQHLNTGHASGALYTPLPPLSAGTLVIEFDWKPVPDRTYTGAFVNIRGKNPDRNVYYGRTDTPTKVTLRAYSYDNVRIELDNASSDYLSPLVTELAHYRIEIDVRNQTIAFYVNGVLEQSYDGFIYAGELFFEFTFGGYSGNKFSFFDNVKIEVI